MDFASALVPLVCTNICAKENDDENDAEARIETNSSVVIMTTVMTMKIPKLF